MSSSSCYYTSDRLRRIDFRRRRSGFVPFGTDRTAGRRRLSCTRLRRIRERNDLRQCGIVQGRKPRSDRHDVRHRRHLLPVGHGRRHGRISGSFGGHRRRHLLVYGGEPDDRKRQHRGRSFGNRIFAAAGEPPFGNPLLCPGLRRKRIRSGLRTAGFVHHAGRGAGRAARSRLHAVRPRQFRRELGRSIADGRNSRRDEYRLFGARHRIAGRHRPVRETTDARGQR